jgi:hypothetical protein
MRDVRQSSSSVSIAWLAKDSGSLQSVSVSSSGKMTKNRLEPRNLKGDFDAATGYTGLKDVGLSNRGYVLALLPNDGADLIKWSAEPETKIQAIFHFEGGDLSSRSSSMWGGFEGANANESWITRLFWSHGLQVCTYTCATCSYANQSFYQLANVNTYNIDHSEGYVYTGGTFQYKDHEHGIILNVGG